MTPEERKDTLEQILDSYGDPAELIAELEGIAAEKQEHVESNWQDKEIGRRWERWSRKLSAVVASAPLNPYA